MRFKDATFSTKQIIRDWNKLKKYGLGPPTTQNTGITGGYKLYVLLNLMSNTADEMSAQPKIAIQSPLKRGLMFRYPFIKV